MSADASENVVAREDPNPNQRLQIGSCDYKNCGRPAYYTINFDCDDMTADVCNKHHNKVMRLFGLPNCEGGE